MHPAITGNRTPRNIWSALDLPIAFDCYPPYIDLTCIVQVTLYHVHPRPYPESTSFSLPFLHRSCLTFSLPSYLLEVTIPGPSPPGAYHLFTLPLQAPSCAPRGTRAASPYLTSGSDGTSCSQSMHSPKSQGADFITIPIFLTKSAFHFRSHWNELPQAVSPLCRLYGTFLRVLSLPVPEGVGRCSPR